MNRYLVVLTAAALSAGGTYAGTQLRTVEKGDVYAAVEEAQIRGVSAVLQPGDVGLWEVTAHVCVPSNVEGIGAECAKTTYTGTDVDDVLAALPEGVDSFAGVLQPGDVGLWEWRCTVKGSPAACAPTASTVRAAVAALTLDKHAQDRGLNRRGKGQ